MTKMTDTAAVAAIGAATRELRLPVVRTDAARLAEIAQRSQQRRSPTDPATLWSWPHPPIFLASPSVIITASIEAHPWTGDTSRRS